MRLAEGATRSMIGYTTMTRSSNFGKDIAAIKPSGWPRAGAKASANKGRLQNLILPQINPRVRWFA